MSDNNKIVHLSGCECVPCSLLRDVPIFEHGTKYKTKTMVIEVVGVKKEGNLWRIYYSTNGIKSNNQWMTLDLFNRTAGNYNE